MNFIDIIPKSDLAAYRKGIMGEKGGFGQSPALIVVDMTYGFVDPRYPTAHGDMGYGAVKAIAKLISLCRVQKVPVIYSRGLSTISEAMPVGLGRKTAVPKHALPARANDIVDEIAPQSEDTIIDKPRASIFFGTSLNILLNYLGVDTTIITGATTSGCVRASVIDASSYSYFVVVPEECVADRAVVPHKVNLFDIHMKYGDVLPLDEVLEYLRRLKRQEVQVLKGSSV